MATIGTLDVSVGGCFKEIGELVVFDTLTDAQYENAKLSTFANPQKVRPLFDGTTTWTGDDPTIEQLKDEDGNVQCSFAEVGRTALKLFVCTLNKALTKKFFGWR